MQVILDLIAERKVEPNGLLEGGARSSYEAEGGPWNLKPVDISLFEERTGKSTIHDIYTESDFFFTLLSKPIIER